MRGCCWIPQGLASCRTPGTGSERQWSREGGCGEVAPFPPLLLCRAERKRGEPAALGYWLGQSGGWNSTRGKQMESRPRLETQTLPAWPRDHSEWEF